MQDLTALKLDVRAFWLAENGGMRLDLEDDAEPFPGHKERRTKNENALYFHAKWIEVLHRKGALDSASKAMFMEAYRNHAVDGGPLLARHPGNFITREAHDNYIGAAAGAFFCGHPEVAESICEMGNKTGWRFDHLNPETNKYDIRQAFQGSDVAFIKMLSGKSVPTIWEWAWLVLAIALTSFWQDKSSVLLTELRLEALAHALDAEKLQPKIPGPIRRNPMPKFMWAGLFAAVVVWFIVQRVRWGQYFRRAYRSYFIETHPIVLANEIKVERG